MKKNNILLFLDGGSKEVDTQIMLEKKKKKPYAHIYALIYKSSL